MEIIDYNGKDAWSREEITSRYLRYASEFSIAPRDVTPLEHREKDRLWIYPVMHKIIDGIENHDQACIQIGIEFIQEDSTFPFGRVLKSNTARALRRTTLSEEQKNIIRKRVFGMLAAGTIPREFHEYAKLLRKIEFSFMDIPLGDQSNPYVWHYRQYFIQAWTYDRRNLNKRRQ